MEKKLVSLANDEIRTGQLITERAKIAYAKFEALRDIEADYMSQLREKYQIGPEFLVLDWMQGFEAVADDSPDDGQIIEVVHDKNN